MAENVESGKNRVDINLNKGDFMFEYELEREEEGAFYVITDSEWRFVINEPEELDENEYNRIADRIKFYDEIINSDDYSEIEEYIDVDSFAKLYLLNEVPKNIDFLYSSVKFYEKEGKLYAGPPWDFDLSAGNYSLHAFSSAFVGDSAEEKLETANTYSDFWCAGNPVFARLLQYDEFCDLVDFYFDVFSPYFEELYADGGNIDTIADYYGDLFRSNYASANEGGAGWDISKLYSVLEHDRFPTYEENLDYLKSWLKTRYEWVKENNDW